MANHQGQNARLSRRHNLALALKLVIQAGSASRKEIAGRMGLTQAAMTNISEELIALGLIREVEGPGECGRMGRRPIPLAIDPSHFRILTVKIGRRRLQSYLTDVGASIHEHRDEPSRQVLVSPKDVKSALLTHIEALIGEWGVDAGRSFAIAIAAPGSIRAGHAPTPAIRRKRYHQPYLWEDLPGFLAGKLHCPVFAENDSNIMALAEQWFGEGQCCSNFVLYEIGEGIGSAAIIDNVLYRGHNNVVAEIGHTTVNVGGERCSCGNYGCLELYAGLARLREKFLVHARDYKSRSYIEDLSELFARHARNDAGCGELIASHAEIVAVGAVSLANIFSPEKIILASCEGEWLNLDPFVKSALRNIDSRAFSAIEGRIGVESTTLGEHIMAYGGTALVMSELMHNLDRLAGK